VSEPLPPDAPMELEIDTAKKRRWTGWIAYILLYLAVAALLIIILVKLWTPVALAVGLVAFIVGYMAFMGYLASRNIDRRE
jgi:hypothetical protein